MTWCQKNWAQVLHLSSAGYITLEVVVVQSCLTLCNPMDCSTPGFPILYYLLEFAQTHVHWVLMPSSHLILCHPLLLLLSIFPNIRVCSNELALHIRRPKYWSFNFSISPSSEYSGLISFRSDWFDLFAASQDSSPNTTVQKCLFFDPQPSLWSNSHIHTWLLGKT